MDLWKLISILISLLALIISAVTFIYNFQRNRKNLDVELLKYYPIPVNGTYIKLNLINKSANSISITNIFMNSYPVNIRKNVPQKYDNRLTSVRLNTFPQKLESYEATEVLVYFESLQFDEKSKNLLTLNTSRGKVYKPLTITDKSEKYHYLRCNL